ncbi:Phenylalanyl-tRNA synthetase [Microdochium bolleyi]|uniref:Phenylalanyl-tRNA synthetase n=1 Tax=Microdochium bolleyi TaxID=196109 RepID=A0A136ILQ1_9PEZI|nr:Phenylalanyl-tRNA synthetase [Microdochium bolleyi]
MLATIRHSPRLFSPAKAFLSPTTRSLCRAAVSTSSSSTPPVNMGENTNKEYLSRAHVAPEVFALRPDYRALLVIVDGLPSGPSTALSEQLLQDAEAHVRSQLAQHGGVVTELPHIAAWRAAFKAFGAKPAKFRSSVEALTRRVGVDEADGKATGGLPRVNLLTDIYNAISIKHQLPFGGEDLDKYKGFPRCIRAKGDERFEASAGAVESPEPGEVVWCDDEGVTCRRWNWRQGPRTALTDDTKKALFIIDALDPVTDEELDATAEELKAVMKQLNPDVVVESRLVKKE